LTAVEAAPRASRSKAPPSLLARGESLLLLGVLGGLVAVLVPEIGSDPDPFRTGPVEPRGVLAPLVRAAGREWDPALLRSAAILAGLLIALAAIWALSVRAWRAWMPAGLTVLVVCLLLLPAVFLQAGLRQATEPWFHVNDSTYQIDIAGELLRDGKNPYGYDYDGTGLERWYSFDGSVSRGNAEHQVALRHFAYFPGTALTAAAWGALPDPFGDYRILVALASLAAIPACLLFAGPLWLRLAAGALLAANPLAVRAAWFGTADAPAVLLLVLAFALLARRRYVWAAVLLAAAVLLKQFALVAVPFFALVLLARAARPEQKRAAGAFAVVLAAGFGPFLIADAGALWRDTVTYGGETYRIIGYGLAGWLLEAGIIDKRTDPYPFFLLAAVAWLPATILLLRVQRRSPELWVAAAAFSISVFLLFFVGRVFQTSYLVWPLAGGVLALLLAASEGRLGQISGARAREPTGSAG
jgi:hypothetical protein